MYALKVRNIGNSLCLVLPDGAVSRLHVKEGDVVCLTDAQGGGFRLTPLNERFDGQMAVAEDIMREEFDVLRVPARS